MYLRHLLMLLRSLDADIPTPSASGSRPPALTTLISSNVYKSPLYFVARLLNSANPVTSHHNINVAIPVSIEGGKNVKNGTHVIIINNRIRVIGIRLPHKFNFSPCVEGISFRSSDLEGYILYSPPLDFSLLCYFC
ncbi:MAG: hypothetical protein CM15mV41_0110 [Caudoviricetes sp.]|nr:MAG: hypothetical protein CM15mV41_0110 [Caudoviricetes sp.]